MAGAAKDEVETNEPEAEAAPVFTKRTPGTKEVIPLVWKLVGVSGGMPVTLMKCTDRTEAETQLERLQIEGYYANLGIFPVEEAVPISASLAKARKQAIDIAMTRAAKTSKAKSRAVTKPATSGPPSPASPKKGAGKAAKSRAAAGKSTKQTSSSAKKAGGSTSKSGAKAVASKTVKSSAKSAKSTKKTLRKRKK